MISSEVLIKPRLVMAHIQTHGRSRTQSNGQQGCLRTPTLISLAIVILYQIRRSKKPLPKINGVVNRIEPPAAPLALIFNFRYYSAHVRRGKTSVGDGGASPP